MRWNLFTLVLAFFLSSTLSAAPAEGTWDVDGVARKAIVHIPTTAKEIDTPVVFVFHGHGGTMEHAARTIAIHTHWPEAIVVYPQGLNTPGRITDPEGKKSGWQHSRGAEGDRDLKFFDAMLASLKKVYKVDEHRIHSTGHSNGGAFTYLLWATRGDDLVAVAPSAAVAGQETRNFKPKPVMHIGGEKDELVKWTWQKLQMSGLRRVNGCDAEGTAWDKAGDLVGTIYKSKDDTPVVTLIHPGDHKFPAEAPKLIVKFFKEHPAKQRR